jgi:hypothetical protein
MRAPRLLLSATLLLALGCRSSYPPQPVSAAAPHDAFWNHLQALCGKAFAGRVTDESATDSAFRGKELTMHVRSCSPAEIRVPFHVGEDRSRTWVITRTEGGLRLKHDHRHADGSADPITQYGGGTREQGSATRQEFFADAHTASLIPAASTNLGETGTNGPRG